MDANIYQPAVDANRRGRIGQDAPGAAHAPHHIYKERVNNCDGRFDDVWDA
jgi:hypothetical protein